MDSRFFDRLRTSFAGMTRNSKRLFEMESAEFE
jgi:hypothetical protein